MEAKKVLELDESWRYANKYFDQYEEKLSKISAGPPAVVQSDPYMLYVTCDIHFLLLAFLLPCYVSKTHTQLQQLQLTMANGNVLHLPISRYVSLLFRK